MNVDQIAEAIDGRRREGSRFVVGIDGFGGAGKSTIAHQLAAKLNRAVVVPMDDFIVKDHLYDNSWESAWDRRRLIDQVLRSFRAGDEVNYQRLEWESGSLGDLERLPDADVLIVEGLTAFHPDAAPLFDYRIWIDTPAEVARERGRARDAGTENEKYWDLWSSNDQAYFKVHRPDQLADAVVSNV